MVSTLTIIGFSSHSNMTGRKDSPSDGAYACVQVAGSPEESRETT